MYGTAGFVSLQLRHIQGFADYTLPGKGRITVNKHGHNIFVGLLFGMVILGCAGSSFYDWIYGLQVTGIGHQFDIDIGARFGLINAFIAEVIFNITGTLYAVGIEVALKISKYLAVGFIHDVNQNVEASPVGHAHKYLLNFVFTCL